jgi:fructose-1,6-bisphosphatase/inositol monophosphatase family enzyme
MNYKIETEFAVQLVKEVGEIMRGSLQIGHASVLKSDKTHVTEIDKRINKRIIEALRAQFPEDGILGEEESDMQDTDKRLWICDPLDGTFPFKCGMPTSMVLLALTEDGKPKLGVAYNPYIEQLFVASLGGGAFANGEQVFVNKNFLQLAGTPIGASGPNPSSVLDIVEVHHQIGKSKAKIQILGVTGYEDVMVGCGQFGGQVFGGITRHDIVVGDIFVREAGGMATDVFGNELIYDLPQKPPQGAILSNGLLHEALVSLVSPHLATTKTAGS